MHLTLASICALLLLTMIGRPLLADDAAPGQRARKFEKQVMIRLNYLLYLPPDYGKDAQKKWPVILFLHGAGERGSDVNRVKMHGPAKLVDQAQTDSPARQFIIISPQCPADQWWHPNEVLALLDDVLDELKLADRDRVYLTGLSMGGLGTWETASWAPEKFAAIAPICGPAAPAAVRTVKDLPIWVFHGEKDKVVDIANSEQMVNLLKKAGADDVRFTRYPEAGHDAWTETYNNPELYEWFLRHRKDSAAAASKRGSR